MPAVGKRNRRSKNGPSIVAARQKEQQAIALRLQGFTLEQIAQKVGYSGFSSAREAINRSLDRMVDKEDVEKYRAIQIARYERFWRKHFYDWRKAADAETRERVLKSLLLIAMRIEKVTGLAKDVNVNFNQNNVTLNSYTVVEDAQNVNVPPEEYDLPLIDTLRQLPASNGNGHANGVS